jgi:hypothetical protein
MNYLTLVWSWISQIHNALPFITAWESNRDHCHQGFHYCSSWTRRHGNRVLVPKQRFSFLTIYNFHFPYPCKPYFEISWFPEINLPVATCLLIRFLETLHMSQCVVIKKLLILWKFVAMVCFKMILLYVIHLKNYTFRKHDIFFIRCKNRGMNPTSLSRVALPNRPNWLNYIHFTFYLMAEAYRFSETFYNFK